MIKPFIGIVLGGIVAFAWSSVSWVALPFHDQTLNAFSNEAAVVEALQAGAEKPGIYADLAGKNRPNSGCNP